MYQKTIPVVRNWRTNLKKTNVVAFYFHCMLFFKYKQTSQNYTLILSRNNQQDATFQRNLLFHRSLKAEHVSSGIPLIIRRSNCICSLWFTYACGDRP